MYQETAAEQQAREHQRDIFERQNQINFQKTNAYYFRLQNQGNFNQQSSRDSYANQSFYAQYPHWRS